MVAFLVALLLLSAPVAQAQSIQEQIKDNNEKIEALEEEIKGLQKQLDATSQQKQTLQGAIKALDLNIQKLTSSITLTQTQIRQKDTEITTLGGDILTTAEKIDISQGHIGDSLRELNELDRQPLAAMLLAGATLSSFFDEAASLAALREGLQNRIVDLSTFKSDLEVDKSAAEKKRTELAALQSRLTNERKSLDIARAEEQSLLKETQNQESQYQALIAQKQAEKVAFEAALFELASGLGAADRSRVPPAGKGILRWPLDNIFITQEFGKTSASGRLYASGYHDGVDFRASIGTPVHAALSGVVLETNNGAVPYCQYGKWVLVKHNNGLTTLYAHLSQISVQKGEGVATGKVIGFSGNTGYATGPHLHFTVYASENISFKQYTCKSGYNVTVPIAPVNAYLDPLLYL